MKDQAMTDILKNFNRADNQDKLQPTNLDPAEINNIKKTNNPSKDAMRLILEGFNNITEGLDADQKRVNQMPAQHKMAKATDTKHPASDYLVGGEEGEPEAGEEILDEAPVYADPADLAERMWKIYHTNPKVAHAVDNSPEPYRALVYTTGVINNPEKVDGTDYWHNLIDQLEAINTNKVTMDESGNLRTVKVTYDNGDSVTTNMAANLSDEAIYDYFKVGKRFNLGDGAGGDNVVSVADVEILEDTISQRKPGSDVHKKQSLSDIFKSMDEAEEEKKKRLEKEFYTDIQKQKELKHGDDGRAELAEKEIAEAMATANMESMIDDMKRLMSQGKTIHLTAKESHISDRYKGEIVDYKLTHDQNEDINESASDSLDELMAQINNLKYFGQSFQSIKEEFRTNNGDTFVALAKKIVKAVQDIRRQGGIN